MINLIPIVYAFGITGVNIYNGNKNFKTAVWCLGKGIVYGYTLPFSLTRVLIENKNTHFIPFSKYKFRF